MAIITGLTVFQNNVTNSLVNLDGNFTNIANAVNTLVAPLANPSFTGGVVITGTAATTALIVNGSTGQDPEIINIAENANRFVTFNNTGATGNAGFRAIGQNATVGVMMQSNGATEVQVGAYTNHQLALITNSIDRLTINNVGAATLAAPTTGASFSATGASAFNVFVATTAGTGVGYSASVNNAGATAFVASGAAATQLNALFISQSGQTTWSLFQAASGNDIRITPSASGAAFTYNWDNAATYYEVGGRDIPMNTQTVAYTLALTDRGKCVVMANSSANVTIPANASIAFPIGSVITFINGSGGARTISITTDTLIFAATGGSGTRTLANNGMCTAVKQQATVWYISGSGLT